MKMTSQTSKFPRRSTRTTKLAVPSTQAVQKGSRSNASANTRKPAEQRKSPSDSGGIIHRLRVWRQDAWEQNLWSTAAYWGDKILTMGGGRCLFWKYAESISDWHRFWRDRRYARLLLASKDILCDWRICQSRLSFDRKYGRYRDQLALPLHGGTL